MTSHHQTHHNGDDGVVAAVLRQRLHEIDVVVAVVDEDLLHFHCYFWMLLHHSWQYVCVGVKVFFLTKPLKKAF